MKLSAKKEEPVDYQGTEERKSVCDLVKSCQNGDTEAMECIYNSYKASLLNLAYRFTGDHFLAEDLLQDIFIKIFLNIKKLKAPEAFKSWIYRIAFNTCMNSAKKKVRRKEVSMEEVKDTGYSETGRNYARQQLEQAIKILPIKQKVVFQLHDVEGFTHNEIAEIMKSSEGTAKSQLFKARMKIRNFIRGV